MTYDETAPSELESARRRVIPRPVLDPTVNLGNVLTIITMVVLGIAAWNSLDKRVVVLEEAKLYQASRDAGQDSAIREKFETIKETMADVRTSVYQLQREGRERDQQQQNRTPRQ